jgi:hypothetical protein
VETKAVFLALELPSAPVYEFADTVVNSAEFGAADPSGSGLANMVVMFAGQSTFVVLLAACTSAAVAYESVGWAHGGLATLRVLQDRVVKTPELGEDAPMGAGDASMGGMLDGASILLAAIMATASAVLEKEYTGHGGLVTESVLQDTDPEVSEVEFSAAMVPEFSAMLLATVLPMDTLEP